MTTQQLPERPNLDQLKKQAKDLLRAAEEKQPAALARFRALPSEPKSCRRGSSRRAEAD